MGHSGYLYPKVNLFLAASLKWKFYAMFSPSRAHPVPPSMFLLPRKARCGWSGAGHPSRSEKDGWQAPCGSGGKSQTCPLWCRLLLSPRDGASPADLPVSAPVEQRRQVAAGAELRPGKLEGSERNSRLLHVYPYRARGREGGATSFSQPLDPHRIPPGNRSLQDQGLNFGGEAPPSSDGETAGL